MGNHWKRTSVNGQSLKKGFVNWRSTGYDTVMTLKVRISYRVKVKPISNTVTNTTDQNNNKQNSIVNTDKIH